MKIIEDNKPLAAILCGFERGGTTLVSEILRQHPNLDSGFECGFLLADKISNFRSIEPYYTNLKEGWQIEESEMDYIGRAETWAEAYSKLIECSGVIKNKHSLIFDKTPKYMEILSEILSKVPNVPCIVIVRDPRAVLWSWAKRSGIDINDWTKSLLYQHCIRYLSYAHGWKSALEKGFGSQILTVQYELLCSEKVDQAARIFDFIKFDFQEAYLSFENVKFPNVYGNYVSTQYLTEYKNHFSTQTCEEILSIMQDFQDWFWVK